MRPDTVNVRFQGAKPEGSGPGNRHGMPVVPVGQHLVKNWPVLDLGEQPDVPLDKWKLEIGGLVENPVTLDWAQFMALPQVEDVSDFHCVTTWSRLDNHWSGVRFRTIAELVVPQGRRAAHPVHRLRFSARKLHPLHGQRPARARHRRRRAARAHVGRQAAAARARRSGADDHAEALRLEGREVDQEDRVSRRRQERVLGRARLLEHRRALVQRSLSATSACRRRKWRGDMRSVRPMLATLEDAPLQSDGLVYEPKYDGIRALVEIDPGRRAPVRIWSRLGNEKTAQFPDLVAALTRYAKKLKGPVVLDGEIVALDEKGRTRGLSAAAEPHPPDRIEQPVGCRPRRVHRVRHPARRRRGPSAAAA